MTTFWMTWKPSGWPVEQLEALLRRFDSEGGAVQPWRIHAHRRARVGDHAIFFKQGAGSARGIFGTGEIIELPRLDPSESPDPEHPQHVAPIRIDRLVDPRTSFLVPYEVDSDYFPPTLVNSQASGIIVKEPLATDLAKLLGMPLPARTPHSNPDWSRDELILALDLFVARPESPPGPTADSVIELSRTLNQLHAILGTPASGTLRNANGVAMKLQNYRRFEPRADGSPSGGLQRGNRLEEEVWQNFRTAPDRLQQVAVAIRSRIQGEAAGALGGTADAILDGIEEAPEGRVLTLTHLRRERSRELVRSKKARVQKVVGRLACEACAFDFAAMYGDRGSGFIECHHTKAVETLLEDAKTHLDDLALLCANCHRMIHAKRPWLSVNDLRALIRAARD